MMLYGSLSSFIQILLLMLHLARIPAVEHRSWRQLPNASHAKRVVRRGVLRQRQFPMIDPVIKWSRQQSPPLKEESLGESRMVDFHSGLWKLLGQISMNDFSQEKSGISKKFYDYYKGTNMNTRGGGFTDSLRKQINSEQSVNTDPPLRSDELFDRIHNSELGNTKLRDLPPEVLKALEDLGHVIQPEKPETVVHIKTESHFYQKGSDKKDQGGSVFTYATTMPPIENEYITPENIVFGVTVSDLEDAHVSHPQTSRPQIPFRVSSKNPFAGELHLVSSSNLPFKFSSGNEIKLADGADSVLEISSESHPTKYFLSASYVDPQSPSGQVKPLPMDQLFDSELFTDDQYKSLENKSPLPMNDRPFEKPVSQPLRLEPPTTAVINTVNKLDKIFYTPNLLQFPEEPTVNDEKVSPDLSEAIVPENDFFVQLQSRLTALASHVDELAMLNHTEAPAKNSEPVVVQISATPTKKQDDASASSTSGSVPIPEHVSEMVKNISEIIGTNPSEEAMNAMIKHFSNVFQHAETILSETFTEIPEFEHQTEPIVKSEPARVPSLSILDSPQHVIIVYRPVLFVSHANNSEWSEVVGQGYKPTVLDEHGETSEALTKEVLNTLGPDLLNSLKEHFADQLGGEIPSSGTRKFPESFAAQMKDRRETFHFRGDYIVIDGQDNETSVESGTKDVSVQEDPQKESLSVDLIVPQNTLRIRPDPSRKSGQTDNGLAGHHHISPSETNGSSNILKTKGQMSKPAEYVHNIIVTSQSEDRNEGDYRPFLQQLEKIREMKPAPSRLRSPSDKNNQKKYVVRRIVKRRRKKPTKSRSKLHSREPSQLEPANSQRKLTDQALEQVRQHIEKKVIPQTPNGSQRPAPLTEVEEGRKNDESPLIILEKPITDLPVDKLANLVMKIYTGGT